jgi:hypothetical protein
MNGSDGRAIQGPTAKCCRHRSATGSSWVGMCRKSFARSTDSRTSAAAPSFFWHREHYELMSTHFATAKGYDAYAKKSELVRSAGRGGLVNALLQVAVRGGTPDEVLRAYEQRRVLLGDFELNSSFRFGGIPFAKAEASMRLFAKEVLKEWKQQRPKLQRSRCTPERRCRHRGTDRGAGNAPADLSATRRQRWVMMTSRYSLGTTMQPFPERLNCATRLMRSISRAICPAGGRAAKVLSTGP